MIKCFNFFPPQHFSRKPISFCGTIMDDMGRIMVFINICDALEHTFSKMPPGDFLTLHLHPVPAGCFYLFYFFSKMGFPFPCSLSVTVETHTPQLYWACLFRKPSTLTPTDRYSADLSYFVVYLWKQCHSVYHFAHFFSSYKQVFILFLFFGIIAFACSFLSSRKDPIFPTHAPIIGLWDVKRKKTGASLIFAFLGIQPGCHYHINKAHCPVECDLVANSEPTWKVINSRSKGESALKHLGPWTPAALICIQPFRYVEHVEPYLQVQTFLTIGNCEHHWIKQLTPHLNQVASAWPI